MSYKRPPLRVKKREKIETRVRSADLKINDVDIFTQSSQPEVQSLLSLDEIDFPLSMESQGLIINGINVFDKLPNTKVVSGSINNQIVNGTFGNDNLVINGVNIFENAENGQEINISSVQQLINAINTKRSITNVEAKLQNIDDKNSRIILSASVPGDNIDIVGNSNVKFSKFRLSQGSTKGENRQFVYSKIDLMDLINDKSDQTNVKAVIRNDKLTFVSTNGGDIEMTSLNTKTLSTLGFQEGVYNAPVGLKISSLDDVAKLINDKEKQTQVSAKVVNDRLVLESTEAGRVLTIEGKEKALEEMGLKEQQVQPITSKEIKGIEDFIDIINRQKKETNIEATKEDGKLVLRALEEDMNIEISGIEEKLILLGLSPGASNFKDGAVIESKQQVADLINDKFSLTGVKAFIREDKLLLNNPVNGNIKLDGKQEKLGLLGLSKEDTLIFKNEQDNRKIYGKLGLHLEANRIQQAQDAVFLYNSVELTRGANTVKDITTGVSIELKRLDSETSSTKATISIDKSQIEEQVKTFVTAYNAFMRKIDDATKFEYDEDEGDNALKNAKIGVFQGVSQITNLPYTFSSILTHTDTTLNTIKNLSDVGISFIDRTNHLELDESKLKRSLQDSYDEVEKFLRGYKTTTVTGNEKEVKGVFTQINDAFNKLTKGDKSTFELLKKDFSRETSRLETNLEKNQKFLDDKYEQMKQDFIANDSAISKINNNFKALQQQIDIETSKK